MIIKTGNPKRGPTSEDLIIMATRLLYTPAQRSRREEINSIMADYVHRIAELHRELKDIDSRVPQQHFPVGMQLLLMGGAAYVNECARLADLAAKCSK